MKYASTFIPGLTTAARAMLIERAPDARVLFQGDGFITYDTPVNPAEYPFFTNTFALLDMQRGASIETMMRALIKKRELSGAIRPDHPHMKTFRVITSDANQLVAVNSQLMQALEARIASQTDLTPNRVRPDVEYWIQRRTEGATCFMRRITQRPSYEKTLKKGQLHPELCCIMNWLSHPSPNDIYLDPFCGSCALPINREKLPHARVIASDIEPTMSGVLRQDALKLPPSSVNKIVTDPPWGFYGENPPRNMEVFYADMLRSFASALMVNGICVVLTGAKDAFTAAISQNPALTLTNRYDILVSGKKAAIFCLLRIGIDAA